MFYLFDCHLDPITFVLKLDLDLDIVKMDVYTENAVASFRCSKVITWKDTQSETYRQTYRLNWNYYQPHSRMVKKICYGSSPKSTHFVWLRPGYYIVVRNQSWIWLMRRKRQCESLQQVTQCQEENAFYVLLSHAWSGACIQDWLKFIIFRNQ